MLPTYPLTSRAHQHDKFNIFIQSLLQKGHKKGTQTFNPNPINKVIEMN